MFRSRPDIPEDNLIPNFVILMAYDSLKNKIITFMFAKIDINRSLQKNVVHRGIVGIKSGMFRAVVIMRFNEV